MSWLKHTNYKHPSGRIPGKRFEGSAGESFRRRGWFWQRRSFKIYSILVIIGLSVIAYFLFWSGFLKIQNIQISGVKTLNSGQIEQIIRDQMKKSRFLVFSQSNLLFFDAKTAQNEVKNSFIIQDIQIKKRPLKTLKIELTEKTSQVTLISNDRYYYLDPNGVAVKEIMVAKVTLTDSASTGASGEDLIDLSAVDQSLPMIYDLSNAEVKIGQKIIDPAIINFVLALRDKLPLNQINIKAFQLPERQGTEVRVVTDKGWSVYFNSTDDLDRQLANLNLVIKEKVKDRKINYIDLRFGNKVYIK